MECYAAGNFFKGRGVKTLLQQGPLGDTWQQGNYKIILMFTSHDISYDCHLIWIKKCHLVISNVFEQNESARPFPDHTCWTNWRPILSKTFMPNNNALPKNILGSKQ